MQFPSLCLLLAFAYSVSAASCSAKDFQKSLPQILGVKILGIHAAEHRDWQDYATSITLPPLPAERKPLNFCNVTVTYTHPGLNDRLRVGIWLPFKDDWNGRFLGQGGGGWSAGREGSHAAGVSLGYATAVTDGGHNSFGDLKDTALTSTGWSLVSPGNVDLIALQNFAYRSLDELAVIGKYIARTYYSKDISYSYWNGCSNGGRQGLVLAQRYPSHFDGILSVAPAINWINLLGVEFYSHIQMKALGYYPPRCELAAITQAAVEECDGLDGLQDGIMSAPRLCNFDVQSIVGREFECSESGDTRKITKEAAEIAAKAWSGPLKNDGSPLWHGVGLEAALGGDGQLTPGLASTTCDSDARNCKSNPFPVSVDYIKQLLLKDPSFDVDNIDNDLFERMLRISRQEYHSMLDSADPDLNEFKESGGKIILWHGLADELIPPNGTLDYYERVQQHVPATDEFLRYFEAPGVGHCLGGKGAWPLTALSSLVDWVERGKAPEQLNGQTIPMFSGNPEVSYRPVCRYPNVAMYQGGDVTKPTSFRCEANFGVGANQGHDEL